MSHRLYDIWEEKEDLAMPWRVQLVNYIGYFDTEEQAKRYVESVQRERKKQGLR